MSRKYRNHNPFLDANLSALERAAEAANSAVIDHYESGARCIVRTKRLGHPANEREAVIVGAGISLNMSFSKPWASVRVNTRNLATGKTTVFYPSVEVDGVPSIRLTAGDS